MHHFILLPFGIFLGTFFKEAFLSIERVWRGTFKHSASLLTTVTGYVYHMMVSSLSQAVRTTWWSHHCHRLCVPQDGLTIVTGCVYHRVVSQLSHAVCTTWWSHHCHKLCVPHDVVTTVTSCTYHMMVSPLSRAVCATWWCRYCHKRQRHDGFKQPAIVLLNH